MSAGAHGDAFSGRIGWGTSPALLVIDLCRAYTEADGPFALPGAEEVVAANRRLVGAARRAGVPVLWTAVRYAADLHDAGWFGVKVPALRAFADGEPGGWGELTLPPEPGEPVVVKQHASGFAGTDLADRLHELAVDTVVVSGVSTSGCVRASATDAIAAGFRPVVVADACGDRSPRLHQDNLRDLDAKYADVVDLAEAEAELISGTRAGSPRSWG
ncbi:isochorismatase family protein [Nocardioides mangrovicus]|uniref:Isochorismatase family protein n=1 Tax=Nocardioides mangrovicus TaxID=2478913 RepID=A0A3L8NZ56_9ACTN|nr:isochorismatase family protein [Nocardioides mangrovicus]RLV48061.1 isochorismatase family protein [Nocardioides mangrovicus]